MSGRRMESLHIWTIKGGKGSEGAWEEARECGDTYLQKGFSHKTLRLPVRVYVQDGPEDFLSAAFPIRQIADDIVQIVGIVTEMPHCGTAEPAVCQKVL